MLDIVFFDGDNRNFFSMAVHSLKNISYILRCLLCSSDTENQFKCTVLWMLNKLPTSDSFFFYNKYIKYIGKVTENYITSRQIDP